MNAPAGFSTLEIVAALLSGAAVGLVASQLIRAPKRLESRVRPYLLASRASLGKTVDVTGVGTGAWRAGAIGQIFGPTVDALARALARVLDAGAADDTLLLKLRQARLLVDVPAERRVQEFRVWRLRTAATAALAGLALSAALGMSATAVLFVAVVGFVSGAAFVQGRLDSAINERRERMRVELYTVNHLLAMYLRAHAGVTEALRRLVARGRGEVIDELADILRMQRGGTPLSEALHHQAKVTCEPAAARTYRVLASQEEYGADVAAALLELSEDMADAQREVLRRAATKRSAAMLVPTVVVLAPVMLLFVGAPLPSLIFRNL